METRKKEKLSLKLLFACVALARAVKALTIQAVFVCELKPPWWGLSRCGRRNGVRRRVCFAECWCRVRGRRSREVGRSTRKKLKKMEAKTRRSPHFLAEPKRSSISNLNCSIALRQRSDSDTAKGIIFSVNFRGGGVPKLPLVRSVLSPAHTHTATQSHAQRKKASPKRDARLLPTRAPFQHIPQHTAAGRRAPGRPPLLVSSSRVQKNKIFCGGMGAFKIKG